MDAATEEIASSDSLAWLDVSLNYGVSVLKCDDGGGAVDAKLSSETLGLVDLDGIAEKLYNQATKGTLLLVATQGVLVLILQLCTPYSCFK